MNNQTKYTEETLSKLILFDLPHKYPLGFTMSEVWNIKKKYFPSLDWRCFSERTFVMGTSSGKRYKMVDPLELYKDVSKKIVKC